MIKRCSLNILLLYPVFWNEYKVLRDFVQNFYDAKGAAKWWKDFSYNYVNEKLTMIMSNATFSYEWLLHIGASSKTDTKNSAGYFGEGFKIAALCAIRDWNWNVSMSSGNWHLNVIKETITIDNQKKQALAYEITYLEDTNESILIIDGISEEQFHIFKEVLTSFFYPENPLFGHKLYEDNNVAVYNRSEVALPNCLPVTQEYGRNGIVFGRFQAIGTVPFPFIIALHSYKQKDRERNALYDFDVIKLVYKVACKVDAPTAKVLLIATRKNWNAYPTQSVDIYTWYYIVCELIRRVSLSSDISREFNKEFPNLLYGERLLENDMYLMNRRRMAKTWMKKQDEKYLLVQSKFMLLDIVELETACEKAGGFAKKEELTDIELAYIAVLEKITDEILGSFFIEYKPIKHNVIRNDKAVCAGKAEVHKRKNIITNIYGLKIRNKLVSISIKEIYLSSDSFEKAVSIYFHELSHMFGGDASAGFSLALTYVNEMLIKKADKIEDYRKKWENICY